MMWMCETDGSVVADRAVHERYSGHQDYREVALQQQRVVPDWYAEQKEREAGIVSSVQEVENWPPHNPKAEQGRAGE